MVGRQERWDGLLLARLIFFPRGDHDTQTGRPPPPSAATPSKASVCFPSLNGLEWATFGSRIAFSSNSRQKKRSQ